MFDLKTNERRYLPAIHIISIRYDVIKIWIRVTQERGLQRVRVHLRGDVVTEIPPGRALFRQVVVVDGVLVAGGHIHKATHANSYKLNYLGGH